MKALTIRQPWAWAIAAGIKKIENRTWKTAYRGPLLIHAALSRDALHDTLADGTSVNEADLHFGAIIGIVDLIDCVPVADVASDPFASGPYCFVLANGRPIKPIKCKGQLGIFNVEVELPQQPQAV